MKELILHGSKIESHILIEKGILSKVPDIVLPKEKEEEIKICIITDTNVKDLYLNEIKESFKKRGIIVSCHIIEAGEEYKTLDTVSDIYNTLVSNGIDRNDMIIALGGGVVGDIAGFAAATYLRGIKNLVQIPTTLLAQVDSSVGGKCGVDLLQGKNLVGAFRQPNQVIIDVNVLDSLTEDIYAAGIAEIIKYGCIWDSSILDEVSKADFKENIEDTVIKCVDIKRKVVEEDETETGLRRILNFGHTIGHGAEKLGNYKDLSHGEAVSVGIVAALKMGEKMGITVLGATERIGKILQQYELPITLNYNIEDVYKTVLSDKKKKGNSIAFIYMKDYGKAEIVMTPIDELKEIMKVLREE
ncbi:3-dehydroquinate synthase [Anaerovorax odorimutans]|uniref:3-dehydroquinate synthase n=1 Tax=Anaerovorax odorimutans TaxID=109327 RepID=UPI00040B3649|nr:3-dehydroquinate synthase [Anaerovorax odorimutans]